LASGREGKSIEAGVTQALLGAMQLNRVHVDRDQFPTRLNRFEDCVRVRAAATYANALAGATLTPSLLVAKDVHGYSYDGTFSKGRSAVRVGLRADWGKAYFADVQLTHFSGGNYNLLVDRSHLMIAVGAAF